MDYIYQDNNIAIRKLEDCLADYSLLAKWLSDPKVLEYYGGKNNPFDLDRVKEKFSPRARGEESVISCIIEYGKQPIGYVQYYKLGADEYNVKEKLDIKKYKNPYGMDIFIGETDYWNKGIGTKLMKTIIKYIFENQQADSIFVDPQTWNKRAIRCYEKSGFKPAAIIEKRELQDGQYKDNLIMFITLKDNNT